MVFIICIGTWDKWTHVNKCWTVDKISFVTTDLLSGLNEALQSCSAKFGVLLGCVGDGGGVAVVACRGFESEIVKKKRFRFELLATIKLFL